MSKELAKLQAVAGAWYQAGQNDKTRSDAASEYRSYFPPIGNGDPSGEMKAWGRIKDKSSWFQLEGYFPAPPVTTPGRGDEPDQTLWPIIAFQLREESSLIQFMIRVVLCAEDETGQVDGWGWRFDSADPGTGVNSHPYAHVQHITTWERGSQGFRWPPMGNLLAGEAGQPIEYRKTTPETRPAVPLRCTDAGGLLVAAMLSLYGPRRTASMLRGVSQADAQFYELSGHSKIDLLSHDD